MYPVCACSTDYGYVFDYHPETDEEPTNEWERSLRPRRCCECYDLIPPGVEYNRTAGWNGQEDQWEIFDTCPTCLNIWDDLCGGDRVVGELDQALWESCGMTLQGEMDDDDAYWEEEWQTTVEYHRRQEASRTVVQDV